MKWRLGLVIGGGVLGKVAKQHEEPLAYVYEEEDVLEQCKAFSWEE